MARVSEIGATDRKIGGTAERCAVEKSIVILNFRSPCRLEALFGVSAPEISNLLREPLALSGVQSSHTLKIRESLSLSTGGSGLILAR